MIFRPVIHPVLLVLILAIGVTFVFLSAKRAARKRVMDVIRRSLIVLIVIVVLAALVGGTLLGILGALIAIILFALWCGRLEPRVSSAPHLEG